MNNYSWLQERLHKFALSTQFMREVTFEAESSLISSNNEGNNHIFIAGLARSGTTILLNTIYESREFASLSYADMPFILAPNLWSKIFSNKNTIKLLERAHGDGVEVSTKSPEAFEEVFWKTFHDIKPETQEKFKIYIKLIMHKYQKERYLSKNNQNIRRLELISDTFPNSKILIPFRNPIQQANSLLKQHKKFIEYSKRDIFISNYMDLIGHSEFGNSYIPIHNKDLSYKNALDINHWLEQWYLTYMNCLQTFHSKPNIYFICYEELCQSKEYWLNILKIIDIDTKFEFSFKESKKDISLIIDTNFNKKNSIPLRTAV
ncbi:sulfotransferase [Gammaproteobacteria bacterium]|nr:sulfotransferase [Gammaproteobacteria bacterium]